MRPAVPPDTPITKELQEEAKWHLPQWQAASQPASRQFIAAQMARLQTQYYSRDMNEAMLTASLADFITDLMNIGVFSDILVEACRLWRIDHRNTRMPTSGDIIAEIRPLMSERRQLLRGLEAIASANIR